MDHCFEQAIFVALVCVKRRQHIFNMLLRNVLSQFFIVKYFKKPLLFLF